VSFEICEKTVSFEICEKTVSFEISSRIKFQVNIVYIFCSKKKLLSYQVLQYFIKILFTGINSLKLLFRKRALKAVSYYSNSEDILCQILRH
jgi:hypothetical protein